MSVSAVRPTVHCAPKVKLARDGKPSDITFKTKRFFSKEVDLSGEKRVIINLADVRLDDGRGAFSKIRRKVSRPKNEMEKIPVLLERLGFDPHSQEKIYTVFGKGDLDEGINVFVNRFVKKGLVTVERIGYSGKNANDPKFYLIVNELQDQGENSTFYKGFSRKGTPRAITKIKRKLIKQGAVVRITDAAQQLFVFLKLNKQQTPSYCCRVMGYEGDVKVSQFGGLDLVHFEFKKLDREQRYQFYISIFEGLSQIHRFGVHRDVKLENIVAVEDIAGDYFAKFIDFDTMLEQKKESKSGGTPIYCCPRTFLSAFQGQPFPISDKDDIWAAMYTICAVESYSIPPGERILSPEFVERFKIYHHSGRTWDARSKWIQGEIDRDEGNLFNRLKPDPAYPVDALVYETAFMDDSRGRLDADQIVVMFAEKEVSDQFTQDSIIIVE